MSLSDSMIDVLTYIEQVWWEDNKSVPTDEKIAEATGVGLQTIKGYWKDSNFRAALNARGVTFVNEMTSGKALSYAQLQVANMLMNIMDKRSLREKLQAANLPGVTPAQVGAWMRQPAFQAHLRRRAQVLYDDADVSANLALVKAIDAGDLKAVQLFLEMTGRYTPRSTVDVNIHAVLARVVEIVSIHVRDPAILEAIAHDMENLELGKPQAIVVSSEVVLDKVNITL
jgi:hypothetical protein